MNACKAACYYKTVAGIQMITLNVVKNNYLPKYDNVWNLLTPPESTRK